MRTPSSQLSGEQLRPEQHNTPELFAGAMAASRLALVQEEKSEVETDLVRQKEINVQQKEINARQKETNVMQRKVNNILLIRRADHQKELLTKVQEIKQLRQQLEQINILGISGENTENTENTGSAPNVLTAQ
jgi:murein L,D-transpeptidase YcbB/YkuD